MIQPLLYKAWLETRFRFLASVLLLLAIILFGVMRAEGIMHDVAATRTLAKVNYTQYVWIILYKGYLLTIFIFSSFILGLGGLATEKITASSGFTLALPVTRTNHIYSRFILGTMQLTMLVLFSAIALPFISFLAGYSYPLADAFCFAILMWSGGLVFISFGSLLSTASNHEFVAPTLGLSIIVVLFFLLKLPVLKPLNIFVFMTGAGHLDNENFLFNTGLNMPGILLCLLVFLLFCTVTVILNRKRDF